MSIERIHNWVVVMFENRSFDNLLGYLPHIDPSDGIVGREILLPYPNGTVRVGPTGRFTDPIPDPGEAYPSVNVQLYGRYRPESNAGMPGYLGFPQHQSAPWNAPDPGQKPSMDGFALDFFHNCRWQTGRELSDAEMQSIGGVYTPETAPVINTLAQQYAVFTHWHCDAPTDTFPNRSFFHAGTSKGRVDNNVTYDYAWDNNLPNLFDRMTEHALPWRCYFAKSQVVPFEAINLGGAHHRRMWAAHSAHLEQFFADAGDGTLPRYSWVEPCMLFGDLTDYHPPRDIRAGEQFLAQIYHAVRNSPQWEQTALVIMFDEHGGCYDHVPPPAAPSPDEIVHQEGFGFDRLGVRVPTVVVSAYTEAATVITDLHTNTSMTRTLRESLGLGTAFTKRDAWAAPIDAAFNRSEPRQDIPPVNPLPYTPGIDNPGAQPIRPGDIPTAAMAVEQGRHLSAEYISELGEATLRSAAVLLGLHPEDRPRGLTADQARHWLTAHFTRRGHLSVPRTTMSSPTPEMRWPWR